jgi:FlaA1/EpsC-like NDP-sugar epimerase
MKHMHHNPVLRNRAFFLLDVVILVVSAIASFMMRLETLNLESSMWHGVALYLVIAIPSRLVLFLVSGMYRVYWLNAGPGELLLVGSVCLSSGLMVTALVFVLTSLWPGTLAVLPRSIPLIDLLQVMVLVAAVRFIPRTVKYVVLYRGHRPHRGRTYNQRIIIIGAGHTGVQVLDALEHTNDSISVVGFLDDNISKIGSHVHGLRVLGKISDLRNAVRNYNVNLVVIAIPSDEGSLIRRIVHDCRQIDVEYKIVPGLHEVIRNKISYRTLRPVSIEDLLRRKPVELDTTDIYHKLHERCVMITGAGGSIGSELARQVMRCRPGRLMLVGHGENSLFDISNRLREEFPGETCDVILADIRDEQRMAAIFEQWRPNVIFHAAAHKHVPLLESNVTEAVTNNIRGTQNLIALCNEYGAERMVLISSDKAVNPSNVMGMSKRVAELLIMKAANHHPQRFVAVRFGNVLGSRGSVVPIFQRQIASGGPVTITSEKMTRFFMSIPEAVLLVLKASVMTNTGSLFVLNMGEPVRIVDLAKDLIRLSGLEPEVDVEIKVTGLRPGEKLCEELFWSYEHPQSVEGGAIFTVEMPSAFARSLSTQLDRHIPLLMRATADHDEKRAYQILSSLVFAPPEEIRSATPALRMVYVPEQ